ncbi:unnamed protein product, partial [Ectocarpus sp. 6 AP-2014]
MKQLHKAHRYKTPNHKKTPHSRREGRVAANARANSPPTEQRLGQETTHDKRKTSISYDVGNETRNQSIESLNDGLQWPDVREDSLAALAAQASLPASNKNPTQPPNDATKQPACWLGLLCPGGGRDVGRLTSIIVVATRKGRRQISLATRRPQAMPLRRAGKNTK